MIRKRIAYRDRRRKSWRKIRTGADRRIRQVCLCALVLEAAYGIRVYGGSLLFMEKTAEEERMEETDGRPERKRIYGISIEWDEGKIRIYLQDEYWKEENRED